MISVKAKFYISYLRFVSEALVSVTGHSTNQKRDSEPLSFLLSDQMAIYQISGETNPLWLNSGSRWEGLGVMA